MMSSVASGWRAAAAATVLTLASLVALAVMEARPRGYTEVGAIFPPWTTREQALARVISAGAAAVRPGAFASILVVHGDDPGVIDRLYAAGAWAVIDPVAFGGCLVRTEDVR